MQRLALILDYRVIWQQLHRRLKIVLLPLLLAQILGLVVRIILPRSTQPWVILFLQIRQLLKAIGIG